ncbi:MAG: MBL fold metallo-hydrolase [Pseudomonadota bacterium]
MRLFAVLMTILVLGLPTGAHASLCYAFVEDLRRDIPGVRYAKLDLTASDAVVEASSPPPGSVRITYVAHSTFRIETAAGVIIATDFFGTAGRANGESIVPTVVTMNHAHETHWTSNPDPAIPYVLRGWDHDGKGPADYKLRVEDVTIRNVTTDIRGWGTPEKDGNSIFVFEVADLCIGHLGHLHHVLTEQHYAKIGRLDIVMAPVDGGMTLDIQSMMEVLKTLKARIVLPMHAWSAYSMEEFLTGMKEEFVVRVNEGPTLEVSFQTMPNEPTVLFMPNGTAGLQPGLSID